MISGSEVLKLFVESPQGHELMNTAATGTFFQIPDLRDNTHEHASDGCCYI
jgi:hypothetical protein